MNRQAFALLLVASLSGGFACAEMNDLDKGYVEQIIKGSWGTLRQVSENMANASYLNFNMTGNASDTIGYQGIIVEWLEP